MRRLALVNLLAIGLAAGSAARDGNPYAVSGANWAAGGIMQTLGMPAECYAYIWDTLQTTNRACMVRPCRYWLYLGLDHRPHGYHHETDTIDDPVWFGDWVTNNPGKIWIIGNEPDLTGQDGLTIEQYARMYHTYYEFITALDPSARFANGALAAGYDAGSLATRIAWYESFLDSYQTQFGALPHVDIWNCHSYMAASVLDPDRQCDEFFQPFCEWVHTARSGAYADAEVWCTEFGVGFWMGPLNIDHVTHYMRELCTRMEQTDLDKWFWFVSRDSGDWANCALMQGSTVTELGQAYSALANSYPNPVEPLIPYYEEEPAPAYYQEFFDTGPAEAWFEKSGDWTGDAGTYRQETPDLPWWGHATWLPYVYEDIEVEVDLRINNASDPSHWVGLRLRSASPLSSGNQAGYLVFIRQDGEIGLHTSQVGALASGGFTVADMDQFHHLRVRLRGHHFLIWVDGQLAIDHTDVGGYFDYGFFGLDAGKTDCSYDNAYVTDGAHISGEDWDDRVGVVMTTSGGWGDPLYPMIGPQYLAPEKAAWWYDYTVSGMDERYYPGYPRLYMFWRARVESYTDQQLQDLAAAAKAKEPGRTIWWALSNEPNDLGQANQSATDFADIYYKFHRNLKLGDPSCKIMGGSILNWDFQSTSVYQMGHAWYGEFRQTWYDNPTYRAYSETEYGLSYPPQDAFNFHAYDLRGVQGTPWAAQSWTYARDQILACQSSLQTYPETAGLPIWLTEFGGLRSSNRAENADTCGPLVMWMREQSTIDRWFWFIVHSDQYGTWTPLELIGPDGLLTSVGKVCRDTATLGDAQFVNWPFYGGYDSGAEYTRPGGNSTADIAERLEPGLRWSLLSGRYYTPGDMRGRTFSAAGRTIEKVTFNFACNYDNALVSLAMDIPGQADRWVWDGYGYADEYAEVDLSGEGVTEVSLCLIARSGFTYPHANHEWFATVSNITLYYSGEPIPHDLIVSNFTAQEWGDDMRLSWWNPIYPGFDHVEVWEGAEYYPDDPGEGDLVCSIEATPGGQSIFLHEGAGVGGTHWYTAFAFDDMGGHGAPVDAEVLATSSLTYPASAQTAGWNLMSLPAEPAEPAVESVCADIIAAGNVLSGNLYSFEAVDPVFGTPLYHAYPWELSALHTGPGYWMRLTAPADNIFEGSPPAGEVTLPLLHGWNLVGCSQPAAVPWAACSVDNGGDTQLIADAAAAGWIQERAYFFENGGYRSVLTNGTGDDDSLRPWRAYWLLTYDWEMELIVPAP